MCVESLRGESLEPRPATKTTIPGGGESRWPPPASDAPRLTTVSASTRSLEPGATAHESPNVIVNNRILRGSSGRVQLNFHAHLQEVTEHPMLFVAGTHQQSRDTNR